MNDGSPNDFDIMLGWLLGWADGCDGDKLGREGFS